MSVSPVILHVSHSDRAGGAAVAARRLVEAQRARGIDARMLVYNKLSADDWVHEIGGAGFRRSVRTRRFAMKRLLDALSPQANGAMQTLGAGPRGLKRAIAYLKPQLLHFHWLGAEMASLSEMRQTRWPVVWTCHDQWVFCGVEHYSRDEGYQTGYAARRALDPDRLNLYRKQRAWGDWKPYLVGPSQWMTRCASEGELSRNWPATTIPNTLDMDRFSPMNRSSIRTELGIPLDKHVMLFGAESGDRDPRKGFDLLERALERLTKQERARAFLLAFGGRPVDRHWLAGIPYRCLGRVTQDEMLVRLYNAADVFVAPSRQDNLPNTMVEAQACGTPCVAFDIGGMGDLIEQPWQGALVPAFDTDAFARAIIAGRELQSRMLVRKDAVARFNNHRIVELHKELYDRIMDEHRR